MKNRLNIFDKLASGEWNAWTAIAHRIDDDNSKSQWDRGIYAEAEVVFLQSKSPFKLKTSKKCSAFFSGSFRPFAS